MAENSRIQVRRKERQQQICRGAMKVFRVKGFHATSMREIAAASEVGLGNLYHYIRKKEDILFLVQKDVMDRLYGCFDECVKQSKDPVEQLVNVIRELVGLTFTLKEEMLFIYTETKSLDRKYMREILAGETQFIKAFESLIRKGIRQGVFHGEKPDLIANIIVFTLSIYPLRGWSTRPRRSNDELLDGLIRFVLMGLGIPDAVIRDKIKQRRRIKT